MKKHFIYLLIIWAVFIAGVFTWVIGWYSTCMIDINKPGDMESLCTEYKWVYSKQSWYCYLDKKTFTRYNNLEEYIFTKK